MHSNPRRFHGVGMDGSSAREQRTFSEQFLRNSAPVQAGTDLAGFQADMVAWLNRELPDFEIIVAVVDPTSNRVSIENLKSSSTPPGLSTAWLKSHLERHPTLVHKLSQGELVGISSEASGTPRPADSARASIVLVPVLHENTLLAIFGVLAWMDDPQPSTEQLEIIRTCAVQCAPSLSRIVELEQLRKENERLRRQVDHLASSGVRRIKKRPPCTPTLS